MGAVEPLPEVDYPGLFRAADAAAVAAQRQHFFAEGVQLALNPVSAGLALLASAGLLPLQNAVLTAVSTTLLVIVLWVARATRWQKLWYDCRNVAEEAKALSWRFMMQLPPFHAGAAPEAAFVRALDDVLRHQPDIHAALGRQARSLTAAVSPEMKRIRQLPPQERAAIYLQRRVRTEQRWYAEKARRSAIRDQLWFAVIFIVQLTAVLAAIGLAVRVASGPAPVRGAEGGVAVVTALGGAVMGWSRSKRFGDLCSSYATSAQTLAGLESTCPSDPEGQLEWMEAVESALAREHETWRTG